MKKMAVIFADNILNHIFLDEYYPIWIRISLKYIHKVPIDNNPVLIQIMAWRRTGHMSLSESMMA